MQIVIARSSEVASTFVSYYTNDLQWRTGPIEMTQAATDGSIARRRGMLLWHKITAAEIIPGCEIAFAGLMATTSAFQASILSDQKKDKRFSLVRQRSHDMISSDFASS